MLDREVDPVEVRAARRRAARTSVPGMFSPWCEATAPADLDRAADLVGARPRARAGAPARRRGRPRRPRGPPRAAPPRRPTGGPAPPIPSSVVRVSSEPCRSSTTPPSTSSIRSFGPGRSPSSPTSRPAASAASRAIATLAACSSRVPWEKLSRKTSAPARISSAMPLDDAGGGPDRGDDLRSALRPRRGFAQWPRRSAPDVDGRPGWATGAGWRRLRRRGGPIRAPGPRTRLAARPVPRAPGCTGAARRPPASTRPTATESRHRNHCPAESSSRSKNSRTGAAASDQRVQRAEAGDHRQHVALDGDVLAPGPALEQEDEAEPEHDQRRGGGGPALRQGAAEDLVDREEGEQRPDGDPGAGRDRESGQRAQQAAAVERAPRSGARASTKDGMPIVSSGGDRQLARAGRGRRRRRSP